MPEVDREVDAIYSYPVHTTLPRSLEKNGGQQTQTQTQMFYHHHTHTHTHTQTYLLFVHSSYIDSSYIVVFLSSLRESRL